MGTWLCLKTVSHESAESSLWWLNSSQWQTQVVLTLTSRTADQSWFNPNPLSASFQQAKGKMVSRKMTTRTQSGLTWLSFVTMVLYPPQCSHPGWAGVALLQELINCCWFSWVQLLSSLRIAHLGASCGWKVFTWLELLLQHSEKELLSQWPDGKGLWVLWMGQL